MSGTAFGNAVIARSTRRKLCTSGHATRLSLMHLLQMHRGWELASSAFVVVVRCREVVTGKQGVGRSRRDARGDGIHSYGITSYIDFVGDSHRVNSPLGARCIIIVATGIHTYLAAAYYIVVTCVKYI